MRFGCCGSMVRPAGDPIGIECLETLETLGYDYIELSIRDIMKLSDAEFSGLRQRISSSALRCEACNNFMAAGLRVTGPGADHEAALAYAGRTFARAAEIGAEVIVFGSPWARDIELDFSRERAHAQMVDVLQRMGPLAAQYGITIAVEHVNRVDGNLYTSVSETLTLLRDVAHPNIRLLLDFFHLSIEKEPLSCMLDAGDALRHIHFARLYQRRFPQDMREDINYEPFFANLKKLGYAHRLSIEAAPRNFREDAKKALGFLKTFQE